MSVTRLTNGLTWSEFRRMFYAVTPNETSFRTVQEVPPYLDEVLVTECLAQF